MELDGYTVCLRVEPDNLLIAVDIEDCQTEASRLL